MCICLSERNPRVGEPFLILRSSAATAYTEVALISPLTPFMLRNMSLVLVLAAFAATASATTAVVPSIPHKPTHAPMSHHKTTHHSAPAHSLAQHPTHSTAGYHSHSSKSRHIPYSRASNHLPSSRTGHIPVRPAARTVSFERTRSGRSHEEALVRGPMPPPLKGSLESLTRQNERVEADGLERILDEDDLASRIEQKLLVPVPASASLTVNPDLPENHRYCRPWTADFLADLAHAHAARFHKPIEVSSAVRTVEYQQELMQTNGNAAAAEGDIVSPHLTGGTIDIAKNGMNRQELGWMRNWLLAQQVAGSIDVEEEFRQPCFHITVYRNYTSPPPDPEPAPRHHHSMPAAQVATTGK